MKQTAIDARSQQMLELLAQGASSRVVAKKLGYSEGTTRVYLHKLYKVIGVRTKTEAVIWQLNRMRAQEQPAAPPPALQAPAMVARAGQCFGEMALAEDLYTALGVMSSFLGPYGHVWEAGMRLKGDTPDAQLVARRGQSRLLWRALLKGDFAYAKKVADEGAGDRLLVEAPSDAMLLASVLAVGGYSGAAERLSTQFAARRKGPGITPREASLLRALRDALERGSEAGITALHELAAEGTRAPIVRQIAMVALFHAYRAKREEDRARTTANAIWAEAESARQQLEAMGVRPLARDAALPRPTRAGARETSATRDKVAAGR
jgi:DNA-binding CsgD family transcriptional regulator